MKHSKNSGFESLDKSFNTKEITKDEAEKLLKAENEKAVKASASKIADQKKDTKSAPKLKKTTTSKKTTAKKTKKVSKK